VNYTGQRAKWKWEVATDAIDRKVRKKDRAKRLKDAYDEVDERDSMVCWVTNTRLSRQSAEAAHVLTHHHLAGRNVKPEWKFIADRIITVSLEAHRLITAGIIEVEGDDARRAIRFHYREGTPLSSRVVKIASRRRSQR
jgi:hypothetical protein